MVIRNDYEIDPKRKIPGYKQDAMKIDKVEKVSLVDEKEDSGGREGNQPGNPEDEVCRHFKELTRTADVVNGLLLERNSSYRFCIYEEDDSIFIDVVVLDNSGNKELERIRNITHEQFFKWVRNIQQGEGLIIDISG